MASVIPNIPKELPILDVSGDDKPLRAKINKIPVIKNKVEDKFADITYFFSFLFFYTFEAFFVLLKSHQKYLLQPKLLQ